MLTHGLHSFVLLLLALLRRSSASVYDEIKCDGTCYCTYPPLPIVVNCPDFCGPGRDLSYTYTFLLVGIFPVTSETFEVKGCVDIEDVNDVFGKEWSVFDYSPTAPAPETGWTCSDFCLETSTPTDGPSLTPTIAPSAAPSFFPTLKNSTAPSFFPTMVPSATPTVSPSKPPPTVVTDEDADSDTAPNSAETETLSISNEVDTNNGNRALLGSLCVAVIICALAISYF